MASEECAQVMRSGFGLEVKTLEQCVTSYEE